MEWIQLVFKTLVHMLSKCHLLQFTFAVTKQSYRNSRVWQSENIQSNTSGLNTIRFVVFRNKRTLIHFKKKNKKQNKKRLRIREVELELTMRKQLSKLDGTDVEVMGLIRGKVRVKLNGAE